MATRVCLISLVISCTLINLSVVTASPIVMDEEEGGLVEVFQGEYPNYHHLNHHHHQPIIQISHSGSYDKDNSKDTSEVSHLQKRDPKEPGRVSNSINRLLLLQKIDGTDYDYTRHRPRYGKRSDDYFSPLD